MGEMKYLVEQETDNVMLPLVHVNGIVGLNINTNTGTSIQTVDLTGEYFGIDSKLFVYQYDNLISLSLVAKLTNEGIEYLSGGNTIELTISALNNTEFLVLDSVALSSMDSPVFGVNTNVYVRDGKLYIKCDSKVYKYALNGTGDGIDESEEDVIYGNIYANGTTTTKSFAPIKPTVPYSIAYFTFPARTTSTTFGPIHSLRELEFDITSDDAEMSVEVSAGIYTLTFTNIQNDTFTLRIRGNFKSFVYSSSSQINSIALENCNNLEWFSINTNVSGNTMRQNTTIESFTIVGKHKMVNMAHFFYGCHRLESVGELEVGNVTNFESFFEGCTSLTAVPAINMDNGVILKSMFKGCTSLQRFPSTLVLPEALNTQEMFFNCTSLQIVTTINAPKVSLMSYMFLGCVNLTNINNINCPVATDADNMLASCSALTSIKCTGLKASIDLRDTKVVDKADLLTLLNALGSVPNGKKSRIYLPNPLDTYKLTTAEINAVTAKNWEFA